jgi:cytochrome c-type biogenesis protein CcmE
MSSGVKLMMGALLVAGAIGYLAYVGAANSWQYYLSVDEAVSESQYLMGKSVRVSGRVVPGSLKVGDDRRDAAFELRGEEHTLHAACRCLLPDNLAENIDVVVEGTLLPQGIDGRKVITRCASKYQQKQTSSASIDLPEKRT